MAVLDAEIEAMSNDDPRKLPLRRFVGRESEQVTLDKAGRIVLPDRMVKAAELGEEVMLSGLLRFFEVWNLQRYEKLVAAEAAIAHDAFKMMG
jgi:MraZ protein